MKLILLPGMDGTGQLFRWLLPYLSDHSVSILKLPTHGPQDYPQLAKAIAAQLPTNENFFLLGESFSSALVMLIAADKPVGLQGVIIVAGFLSSPKPAWLRLAAHLPLTQLLRLPGAKLVVRYLGFTPQTSNALLKTALQAMTIAGNLLLQQRIKTVGNLPGTIFKTIDHPCLLIQAANDKLVSIEARAEFSRHCKELSIYSLSGPHFILQTYPQNCAEHINHFIAKVSASARNPDSKCTPDSIR